MGTSTILLIILISILVSIALSFKLNVNLGIITLIFAYVIGCFGMGMKVGEVVALWPTKVIFQLMTITMFFAFAVQNGTLKNVADQLLYRSRNYAWAIPFAIFFISFIISAIGAPPPVSASLMAVISFAIAAEAGIHPLLVAVAVCYGGGVGSNLPFAVLGSIIKGVIGGTEYVESAGEFTWSVFANSLVGNLIFLIIVYVIFKGYKTKSVNMEKPAPLNDIQKKNLFIILIAIAAVIIPPVLRNFFKTPLILTIARNADIQMIALIGVLVCTLMKLGDEKKIIKDGVPWNTIVLVGGVSTLVSVATVAGATEFLASWVSSSIPTVFISFVLVLLGGFMSFFSNGITVAFPMLAPMVATLAGTTLNPQMLYSSIAIGCAITAISPFSTGGSLIIANCHDESMRSKLFNGQLVIALFGMIVMGVLSSIGVFNIF